MKSDRQNKILELISNKEIETQDELLYELKQAGFNVTQATVSRDIRELKIYKVTALNGKSKYAVLSGAERGATDKYERVLKEGFVSDNAASNILVIHTVSGMAMAVATAIDALDFPSIVGCIAGDDTIFCAVRSDADIPSILKRIDRIVRG